MRFTPPLQFGHLIKRYKRFLADVQLDDGSIVTAHCTNTGSMKTCSQPGWRVGLSASDNPKRKHAATWELIHNGSVWIGINTLRANRLAEEAIRAGKIPELDGYDAIRPEQKYGTNSRIDLLLERDPLSAATHQGPIPHDTRPCCYVEVKNVSMLADDGSVAFPDAVTQRGLKHLLELESVVTAGHRAVMLFVVQRQDATFMRPAWDIDPAYSQALLHAVDHGVEALAYQADVSADDITLCRRLPIELKPPLG